MPATEEMSATDARKLTSSNIDDDETIQKEFLKIESKTMNKIQRYAQMGKREVVVGIPRKLSNPGKVASLLREELQRRLFSVSVLDSIGCKKAYKVRVNW